ncbi:MAG: hypothetical protein HXY40_20115 [Chloroflexi bacterium]|nr:hypothetical protein [Chloroflexota bacterium]
MPEPLAGCAVELTLRSLVELTEAMCALVECENYDALDDMLSAREALLAKQAEMLEEWRLRVGGERDAHRFGPLLDTLKQVDKKFSTLCGAKLAAAAERLSQAQNEKLLIAYSQ